MSALPRILTLDEAADLARVTTQDVRDWIRDGPKAMPVGSVGKRGLANYRLFDVWLYEYMQRRADASRRAPAPQSHAAPTAVAPRQTRPRASADSPIGLCPKPKRLVGPA